MTKKDKERESWNKLVTHPLQSWEWGEFRVRTGIKVVRFRVDKKAFQMTIHKIPGMPFNIGYLPKSHLPTQTVIEKLKELGRESNCIFIQIEPNVELGTRQWAIGTMGLRPSIRPLFTKYNFVIDLTKSEEELLAAMHSKTRYNIRVAQRYGVKVEERTDEEAFKIYLKLYFKTTKRQHYFGHTPEYHRLMWKTLKSDKGQEISNKLSARILIAIYKKEPLVAWMLFKFGNTFYYPYGGSSEEHKNVMASNLVAWEGILLGKKMKCAKFDMWGALGPDADPNDPWFGFHKFKQGYGGRLVEYVGSYDLVLNPFLYWGFHLIDKLRWLLLRLKGN